MPRGKKGTGQPRSFNDIFSKYKTYDPEKEGYGNADSWKGRFRERMGYKEAVQYLDDDSPLSILGFGEMPTIEELKSRYRKLIFQHHPDRGGDTATAQKIIAAYTVLLKQLELREEVRRMNKKNLILEREDKINKLLALSEIMNSDGEQGYEYWLNKTGVDPREIPEYIEIKGGICYMKEKGRNALYDYKKNNSSETEFIEEIRNMVREELLEMTTTADIGGYTVPLGTPPANFKKNDEQFTKNNRTKNPKKKKARQTIFGPQSGNIKKGNKAPYTTFAKGQSNVPFNHKSRTTKYGVSNTPASSLVNEWEKRYNNLIFENDSQGSLFDITTVKEVCDKIRSMVNAPVVGAQYSTLGGEHRVSILVVISLDPRETWVNGILENSRMFRMSIDRDGTIEQFSKSFEIEKKFRKTRAKSIDDIISKINKYIELAEIE